MTTILRRKLFKRTQIIGRHHDPYMETRIIMDVNHLTIAYCESGLRERAWVEIDGEHRECKPGQTPEELFEEWTKLSPDMAEKIYERNYQEDPMGCPGMYM